MFDSTSDNSIPDDSDWIVYRNWWFLTEYLGCPKLQVLNFYHQKSSDPAESYEMAVFSFPSNYEGDNARTYIKTKKGHFDRSDIVLLKFPSAVKNLHFDTIDQMQIDGVVQPGNYAETVTLTNIPPHVTEIWFDFDYLDTYKGTLTFRRSHP